MQPLNIAYFGTPDFSSHFLKKILDDHSLPLKVQLVVTQPDKPVGRKHIMTPSPVKNIAIDNNIPVEMRHASSLPETFKNIDLAVLFAFGEIIKPDLLHAPKFGFWNIHPSLLPLYRGSSPVAYPLLLGDTETGVTLIQMDEQLDHGPIIAQKHTPIEPTETREQLTLRLTEMAYKLFVQSIEKLQITNYELTQQDHNQATYTRLLQKNDGFIPFSALKKAMTGEPLNEQEFPQILREYYKNHSTTVVIPAQAGIQSSPAGGWIPDQVRDDRNNINSAKHIYNLFRGLFPWPGIWTQIQVHGADKRLKITDCILEDRKLILKNVQMEGKKDVDFSTFQKAYHIF